MTDQKENDNLAFRKTFLGSHNEFRSKHNSLPLKYNSSLDEKALECAVAAAETNTLTSVDLINVGQNMIAKTSGDLTGEHVSLMWYEEEQNYDYESPGFKSYTGSFTQMIWKGTKEVGIGRAFGENGSVFVVAIYQPPGNIKGQYEDNVEKPLPDYYDNSPKERICCVVL